LALKIFLSNGKFGPITNFKKSRLRFANQIEKPNNIIVFKTNMSRHNKTNQFLFSFSQRIFIKVVTNVYIAINASKLHGHISQIAL
jgi:hypothetical protein